MSANYQYSRLILKRSAISGTTPTINTGSTDHTDGSWSSTDLYEGELFLNSADDLMWVRTSNGLLPISISGGSTTVTSGANVGTGAGVFDTNNAGILQFKSLSAGTNITITTGATEITINSSGGGGTGGSTAGGTNTYTGGTFDLTTVNVSGGTFNDVTITGNTIFGFATGTTLTLKNSGATANAIIDASSNTINTGVTNSSIVAGSGNTINANLNNVFVAGVGITAASGDTAYFSKLNATTILSGGTNLYDIFTTSAAVSPIAGNYIGVTGSSVVSLTGSPVTLAFAISDETTAITSGTSKLTYYLPHAMTLTSVRACLTTSGSTLTTIDINEAGSSILSTKLTIDANEFSSTSALNAPVISDANLADDAKITFDIDGAGTGAAGLKVTLIGFRTL